MKVLSFQDSLPLQDFFVVIDQHFALRELLKNLKVQLEQKTGQFRIIQKRMLTRFKVFVFSFLFYFWNKFRTKTQPL